jgi:aspartate racemase
MSTPISDPASAMKTLGLIGGMSAESTLVYYREMNRLVRGRLGGLHSARLILWSVDFAPIAELQAKDDWTATGEILADAARRLAGAGAEAVLICANTMHINAPDVRAAVGVPLIHIADATATALRARGVTRPLLLATRYTMEKAFYRDRMAELGLPCAIPEAADRDRLQAIIFDELCQGVVTGASKAAVLEIIDKGRAGGCDSVIFGCTEIGLLLDPAELNLPAVDTAVVHCEAAVDFALG